MNPIDLRQKVSGRYTFEVVNKNTGQTKSLSEKADNLLLTSFFREAVGIGSGAIMNNIVVGAGNTPPVVTNTTLENFVASSRTDQGGVIPNVVNSTVYPRYATRAIKKRFNGTAVANIPLSEVGLAIMSSSSGNAIATTPLGSRALITDPLGNPTSIVVNSDEFLDVTYELTTYALDGVTGSFNVNVLGALETFEYEIRPESMLNTSAWPQTHSLTAGNILYARTFPGASGSTSTASEAVDVSEFIDPSSSSYPAANPNNLFTSYKTPPVWDESTGTATGILNLPLNNSNFPGGIRSFRLTCSSGQGNAGQILGVHRMMLDRPLMKTSDHIFEFPITLGLTNATPPGI